MTNKLISVIMPVRNAASYLVEAIESIKNQTHKNWELLCIDDASTDGSSDILAEYAKHDSRIKIYTNKVKKGIGYSLNQGLQKAQGSFIARMDADDVSLPERLSEQLSLLIAHPHIVACGGQAAMIDHQGSVFAYKRFPTESHILYQMIMKMVPIQHPILMVRAQIFKKYRYKETIKTGEDVDMLFFLLSEGSISNVASLVYKYRKSELSNGYHNVKQTFYTTLQARIEAIKSRKYHPSISGISITIAQCLIVTFLPSKAVVRIFEAVRLDPPIWKRNIFFFMPKKGVFGHFKPALQEAVATL